ncbi:hypothetical protein ACCT30_48790, partial [Rhizobium ruizarguesonis]
SPFSVKQVWRQNNDSPRIVSAGWVPDEQKPALPSSAAMLSRRRNAFETGMLAALPSLFHSRAEPKRHCKTRDHHQKNQKIFTNTLAVLPRSA